MKANSKMPVKIATKMAMTTDTMMVTPSVGTIPLSNTGTILLMTPLVKVHMSYG